MEIIVLFVHLGLHDAPGFSSICPSIQEGYLTNPGRNTQDNHGATVVH